MRYIYIITISLILTSCGPSQEAKNIAAVTCSIMGETRDIDAAVRVREMNNAREKIGGEPFLKGDSVIQEAFEYGLCQQLVLNENYNEALQLAKDAPSIKEEFYENGQLKARVNYQSKNDGGKLDGLSENYYENGQLRYKENYKDGELDGLAEGYGWNGQLRYKENYKDGKQDGLAEGYYDNGQLKHKGNWKDGKLDGLKEDYHDDGSFSFDECYKNGKKTDDSYCKPQ